MKRPINENFEDYRREFWKGLTLRQTLHAAGGVAAGVAAYCIAVFLFGIPSDGGVWIALPAGLPIIVPGFVRIRGMSLWEWAGRMRSIRGASYTYKCEFLLAGEETREAENRKPDDRKKKPDAAGDRKKAYFEPPEAALVSEVMEDAAG